MRTTLHALSSLCLVLLALTASSAEAQRRRRAPRTQPGTAARADADATTRARTLFGEGVRFTAGHNYVEAEARFREALALRDAPAIRYNLASVLFEQGKYSEAQVHNERVVGDMSAPAEVRESAHQLHVQIADRAGYLRVAEGAVPAGAVVTIDGFTIEAPTLETPVAPGHRTLLITGATGEVVFQRELELERGARHILGLELIPRPVVATVETPSRPLDQEDWFWPVVGTGIGVVVVVVVVATVASTPNQIQEPVPGNFSPGVIRW